MEKLHKPLAVFFFSILLAGRVIAFPTGQDSIFPLTSYIHYGEEQGLTTKTVYSIIQDHEGFIWMGTDAGVFRFDGKKFKRFTMKDGLSDNEVLFVYQDRLNRIWFLTLNGHLSFWKEGKIYNSENTLFLRDAYTGGTIRSAYEDREGRLWLGTEQKGFIMINGDSAKIIEIIHKETDSNPFFLHEDNEGDIWSLITKNEMIKIFGKNSSDTIHISSGGMRHCYHEKNKHETYYLGAAGVFKINDRLISSCIYKSELASFEKTRNIITNGDTIWLCTLEGTFEYINGRFNKKYLEDVAVTLIFKDREGNLWFSAMDKGVFMLPIANSLITNLSMSTGLSGEKVLSITNGNNNSIWIGYNNGMVDCISNNKKKTFRLNYSHDDVFRVTSLLIDSERTWCGTDVGIYIIESGKVSYLPLSLDNGLKIPFSVKRIFKDSKNRIYCTSNINLVLLSSGATSYHATQVFDKTVRTFSGIEYKKDDFIISSMTGLIEYVSGKRGTEYKTDIDFSSIRVLDVKSDDDHLIVLATNAGLYTMLNGKIIEHLSQSSGLSDDYCNRVYISGNHMYVSTSNGLNILEKKDNVWEITEIKTIQNGLLSNAINDVAVDNDNIYIGTDNGLSVVKKTDTVPKIFVGRVSITELITDSVIPVSSNHYSFNRNIPRLVMRFAYPIFNPVNIARIEYRLLQNEKDNPKWHHSQNNEVEFSSLNPGNYIFQLKPDFKMNDSSAITNFYINIKPLWWQTITARFFFSAATICFVGLFFVQRTKRRYEFRVASLKQISLVEKERNRIASDMHDDIGADLTQISMMANIVQFSKERSDELIEKISKTSNEVLRKIDHIIWTLDSTHDHLPDLVYFIHESISKYLESSGISFKFETQGEIPNYKIDAIKRRNVYLVIKELVHNSVKHSGASMIEIKVYYVNSLLNVVYNENGRGYVIGEATRGLGHITLKKRMEEIDSRLDINTEPGKGVIAHLIIRIVEGDDLKLQL